MTLSRLPPLNSLRAFLAAARSSSFAKAAEELNVTPAAVSQQVKQLEDVLGIELFRRLPRGLILTEPGRSAVPELEKGFTHLARAVADMRGGSLAGPVTISVIPSFAARWLVQAWATRRAGRPMIPRSFWIISLTGSAMVTSYFIWGKNDSVGVLTNLLPASVAMYNLVMDIKAGRSRPNA